MILQKSLCFFLLEMFTQMIGNERVREAFEF